LVTFIRPIFFYHKLVNSSPALGFGGVVTPPGWWEIVFSAYLLVSLQASNFQLLAAPGQLNLNRSIRLLHLD
jgi:hypothetical protein